MPAVTKTILVPLSISRICSLLSIAAARANFGIGATAETFGEIYTELQLMLYGTAIKRLQVGVGHNKLNIFDALLVHVVHRIASAAAHTRSP